MNNLKITQCIYLVWNIDSYYDKPTQTLDVESCFVILEHISQFICTHILHNPKVKLSLSVITNTICNDLDLDEKYNGFVSSFNTIFDSRNITLELVRNLKIFETYLTGLNILLKKDFTEENNKILNEFKNRFYAEFKKENIKFKAYEKKHIKDESENTDDSQSYLDFNVESNLQSLNLNYRSYQTIRLQNQRSQT